MNTFETNEKIEILRTRKSQQRNRRYKKEPNGNFRIEKYNNQNLKTQWIESTAEWRGLRKESVSLKTEEQKLPNLKNREKIDWGKRKKKKKTKTKKQCLWELWGYNKRSNPFVIGSWQERRIGRTEKVHEEIMATIFPKDINIQIQEAE